MDLVTCPECGQPADVEWRSSVSSTDGPVELAKIRCTQWHHFMMPAEQIAPLGTVREPVADRSVRIGAR